MSDEKLNWVEIEVDDELKHELEMDAPLVFERHGARWQVVQIHQGIEHVAVSLVSLFGVMVLAWPAQPMLVFLVLSMWAGVAFDAARWYLSPGAVEDALHYLETDSRFWRSVEAWQRGEASFSMREPGDMGAPGIHVLIAVICAIGFTIALTIDLGRAADTNLALLFMSRPDMLALMLLTLLCQYGMRIADFRGRPQTSEEINALNFNPQVEIAIFALMFVLWMVFGLVYVQVMPSFGREPSRETLVTLFVVAAYLIMLWRGVGEIRAVGKIRRQIAWLQKKLAWRGRAETAG